MSNQTDEQGGNIQELRDAADRGRQATAEAEALKREVAMLRAGVDTDTALGQMFVRAYDGALEPDAVKAAWAELAPTGTPSEQQSQEQPPMSTPEQITETETRRTLTTGGAGQTVGEKPDVDPVKQGYKDFHEALADGQSRERASGAVFGSILSAAAGGDERVIWSGWKPEDLTP